MSWLTNTFWARHSGARVLLAALWSVTALVPAARAQVTELHPPAAVTAGNPLSLETVGQGEATFYLVGPSHSSKRTVRLGQSIEVRPEDLQKAGRYLAILCTSACRGAAFHVVAADAAHLAFLVHPSRVPARQPQAISGVALPFDRFRNRVLPPVTVTFRIGADGVAPRSHVVSTEHGVAWFRASAGSRAGDAQVTASLGEHTVRRVVRQVASDPCDLRITARSVSQGIAVETAPVRDCAGNPVPDGTIVTFTKVDADGESTVDAPVKKGIARAQMTGSGPAVITVASGLVMGNQIRLGR